MSDAKGSKKENLFASLSVLNARAGQAETTAVEPVEAASAPPALPEPAKQTRGAARKEPRKEEPAKGKRGNPDYCQANAYVPKRLRRAVEKALLDIDGLDYSQLVEELLRKWLKSRGVSE